MLLLLQRRQGASHFFDTKKGGDSGRAGRVLMRETWPGKAAARNCGDQDEVYLNLVLEYMPETIHRGARNYARSKHTMPLLLVKVSTQRRRTG